MADNVKWFKIRVGMFDGDSFKKIKRAKIGGISYRDKLTAIWFELLDLAAKGNNNGFLLDGNEVPFHSYEEIATMLDREDKEIELCMKFFIAEKMIEIIDDMYCLSNWIKYQSVEGLDKIREQTRIRVAKCREQKKIQCNATVTERNAFPLISISLSNILISYNLSNKLNDIIYKWCIYKKEKNNSYKDVGFKQFLTKLTNDMDKNNYSEEFCVSCFEYCMAQNWQGFFWNNGCKNNTTYYREDTPKRSVNLI